MVYSLRIVVSQWDKNYISLSKIQGGGSVDGRFGFVQRSRVKAIDLLTIKACKFLWLATNLSEYTFGLAQ